MQYEKTLQELGLPYPGNPVTDYGFYYEFFDEIHAVAGSFDQARVFELLVRFRAMRDEAKFFWDREGLGNAKRCLVAFARAIEILEAASAKFPKQS